MWKVTGVVHRNNMNHCLINFLDFQPVSYVTHRRITINFPKYTTDILFSQFNNRSGNCLIGESIVNVELFTFQSYVLVLINPDNKNVPRGSMRTCLAVGPRSIPGRNRFPG